MAIEVGNIFEGRVTGVKPFGAFVALPEGRTGMVHISEVSNEYVQDIAAVLHDGDTVKVQVINVAPDGKIALSIKRLLPPAPRAPRPPREGGFGHGGIIPRGGKLGRQVWAGIFYIGQPNIYIAGQCLDGLQRLIPAGIVYDRQGKTCRPCGIQRGQHPGQVLGGGDKV